MKGWQYGVVAMAMAAAHPADAQQQKARSNQFDGKYSGTMNCSVAGNSRFNGLTVRQGKFSHTFKTSRGAGSLSCAVAIRPDGTFDNQACDLPTAGKADGGKLDFTFKSPEKICDVHLTRDAS